MLEVCPVPAAGLCGFASGLPRAGGLGKMDAGPRRVTDEGLNKQETELLVELMKAVIQ